MRPLETPTIPPQPASEPASPTSTAAPSPLGGIDAAAVQFASNIDAPGKEASKSIDRPPTPSALRLWKRRLHLLNEAQRLVNAGYTHAAAASEIGIGVVTFWKLRKRFAQGGSQALIPKPSGHPAPLIDPSIYSDDVVLAIQRLACVYGSAKAGAMAFARLDACPRVLADYVLRRRSIPGELRRRIGFKRRTLRCRTAGQFVRIEGIPVQIAAQ